MHLVAEMKEVGWFMDPPSLVDVAPSLYLLTPQPFREKKVRMGRNGIVKTYELRLLERWRCWLILYLQWAIWWVVVLLFFTSSFLRNLL